MTERQGLVGKALRPINGSKRKCTDVVCLTVFLLLLLAFMSFTAMEVHGSHPMRLMNGVDWDDNFCGTENVRIDLQSAKYLYIANPESPKDTAICVDQCPTTTNPDDPDAYVCRYRFRTATLEEKLAALNQDCWLAYESRPYLHACYSATVSPLSLAGARGRFGDAYVSRATVVLYGGIVTAVLSYLYLFVLRLSPSTMARITILMSYLALLVLGLTAHFEAEAWRVETRKLTPEIRTETAVSAQMQTISTLSFVALAVVVPLCILSRKTIILGADAIAITATVSTGFAEYVAGGVVLIQLALTWMVLTALPALASYSIKIAPQDNSYLAMDADSRFRTVFIVFNFVWFVAILLFVAVFLAMMGVIHAFYRAEASISNWTYAVRALHFHWGTLAVSSLILFPFGWLSSVMSLVVKGIQGRPLFAALSSGHLVQTAAFGVPFRQAVDAHAFAVFGAPKSTTVVTGSQLVMFCAYITLTVVTLLLSWPVVHRHASGDAIVSSVAVPLGIIFGLSLMVSRTILSPMSGALDALAYGVAIETRENGQVNASSPEMAALVLDGSQRGGTKASHRTPRAAQTPKEREEQMEMGGGDVTQQPPAEEGQEPVDGKKLAERATAGMNAAEEQMQKLMSQMGMANEETKEE